MANSEHLKIARGGTDAIHEWALANAGRGLELHEADLKRANLRGAWLRGARMARADLSDADLREADLFQAYLSGADLSRANLSRSVLNLALLSNTKLSGANLVGADLGFAILNRADLTAADLTDADLNGAGLILANLSKANFCRAHLSTANLTGANLSGANFTEADMIGTNLNGAELKSTQMSNATFGVTSLADVDMSQVLGIASVTHGVPSSVGVDTLVASFRGAGNKLPKALLVFFRDAGVPEELLEELPRIIAEVKYYRCFISYGQPDLDFAKKLTGDLKSRGVPAWLYDLDATAGERTWREILEKRREAEKMVVLCSAGALVRDGVLKEIEEQIDEDPEKLIPISLDETWKQPGFRVMRGSRDLKPFLLDRNYADFAALDYGEALDRLLAALRRKTAPARRKR